MFTKKYISGKCQNHFHCGNPLNITNLCDRNIFKEVDEVVQNEIYEDNFSSQNELHNSLKETNKDLVVYNSDRSNKKSEPIISKSFLEEQSNMITNNTHREYLLRLSLKHAIKVGPPPFVGKRQIQSLLLMPENKHNNQVLSTSNIKSEIKPPLVKNITTKPIKTGPSQFNTKRQIQSLLLMSENKHNNQVLSTSNIKSEIKPPLVKNITTKPIKTGPSHFNIKRQIQSCILMSENKHNNQVLSTSNIKSEIKPPLVKNVTTKPIKIGPSHFVIKRQIQSWILKSLPSNNNKNNKYLKYSVINQIKPNNEISIQQENSSVPSNCFTNKNVNRFASSTPISSFNLHDVVKEHVKMPVTDLPSFVSPKNGSSCVITYLKSPSDFYISHYNEINIEYDTIHEELEKFCISSEAISYSSKEEMMNSKNLYFTCFYHNNDKSYDWHRCKLIDWLLDNKQYQDSVKIFIIDEGFEQIISVKYIRNLSEKAASIPPMAQKCGLLHIYPPGSTPHEILEEWPESSKAVFRDFTLSGDIFTIKYIENASDGLKIKLVNSFNTCISIIMLVSYTAVCIFPDELPPPEDYIKSDFMINQVKQSQGVNDCDENIDWNYEHFDLEVGIKNEIAETIKGGYPPQNAAQIYKFTDKIGTKRFKGSNFEHKLLPQKDQWTSDKHVVYVNTINQLEIPAKGTMMNLLVTHVVSGSTFYAQIKNKNRTSPAKILLARMNNPNSVKLLKKINILPVQDELVLARFSNDNLWYRARVLDVDKEIQVFFIDYGNTVWVKFNDVRQMVEEFLLWPEQAILFNISKAQKLDEIQVEQSLQNLLDREVCARLMG